MKGEREMTKVGEYYLGGWPERQVNNLKVGDVVRYPRGRGMVARGTVAALSRDTVLFTNNEWCYRSEVSADAD